MDDGPFRRYVMKTLIIRDASIIVLVIYNSLKRYSERNQIFNAGNQDTVRVLLEVVR